MAAIVAAGLSGVGAAGSIANAAGAAPAAGGQADAYHAIGLTGDAYDISPNGEWVVSLLQSSPFTATLTELSGETVVSSQDLPQGFFPLAVNDNGMMAGSSGNQPAIAEGGAVFLPTAPTTLPNGNPVPPGVTGSFRSLNDAGVAVGQWASAAIVGTETGFAFLPGDNINCGGSPPMGCLSADAKTIDASGTIYGSPAGSEGFVQWSGGLAAGPGTDINPSPPSGLPFVTIELNGGGRVATDGGDVLVRGQGGTSGGQACYLDHAGTLTLVVSKAGFDSNAAECLSVNGSGTVVGEYEASGGALSRAAFVWSADKGLNLLANLVAGAGNGFFSANAISDTGVIVGNTGGANPGGFVAFPGARTPVVTGVAPSSGPSTGGTHLTITGSGFGAPGDAVTVALVPQDGGAAVAATQAVVVSDTEITAVSADASDQMGSGSSTLDTDVEVTTGSGTSATSSADVFTYDSTQRMLSISDPAPLGKPSNGTATIDFTVALSGPLSQTVLVDYTTANGTATSPKDYTAASGTASIAPGATTATIPVTIPGGSAKGGTKSFSLLLSNPVNASLGTASATGTIVEAPIVTQVSPAALGVRAIGGPTITITGSGFVGATRLYFDTPGGAHAFHVTASHFTVSPDGTQLTLTEPDNLATILSKLFGSQPSYTLDARVHVGRLVSAVNAPADQITFGGPVVEHVSPSILPARPTAGVEVVLIGSGFDGATRLNFDDPDGTHGFHVTGPQLTVSDDGTQITFLAPDNLADILPRVFGQQPDYTLDVRVLVGPLESAVNAPADQMTFVSPQVHSVSPTSMPIGPTGATITIEGDAFDGASRVEFTAPDSTHGFYIVAGQFTVSPDGTEITFTEPDDLKATLKKAFGVQSSYTLDARVKVGPLESAPNEVDGQLTFVNS